MRVEVHGRHDPGAVVAQGRRRAAQGAGRRSRSHRVLHTDDLVRGDNAFFCATGITDGDLLRGVRYRAGGCTTQSIVMRSKSGTVRMIDGFHRLTKLREYSSVPLRPRGTARSRRTPPAAVTAGFAPLPRAAADRKSDRDHFGGLRQATLRCQSGV